MTEAGSYSGQRVRVRYAKSVLGAPSPWIQGWQVRNWCPYARSSHLGPDRCTAPEEPPPLFYWRCWSCVGWREMYRITHFGISDLLRFLHACQIEALQSILTDSPYLSVNHPIKSPACIGDIANLVAIKMGKPLEEVFCIYTYPVN